MIKIQRHREADKELAKLPASVRTSFAAVEEALSSDPMAPGLTHKREAGWGRRTMLVADARFKGAYRMAWEVVDRSTVLIWAYGPHEGFYDRLKRRARQ